MIDVQTVSDLEAAEELARRLEDKIDRVALAVRAGSLAPSVLDRIGRGREEILGTLGLAGRNLDELAVAAGEA